MSYTKKYSQGLIDYIKELKYAKTNTEKDLITRFAYYKVKREYQELNLKERKEIIDKV